MHLMVTADTHAPLTEDEWDEFENVLIARKRSTGGVLGLFAAVAVHPAMIMPSQWLPIALGELESDAFESADEARVTLELFMRAYNDVVNLLEDGRPLMPPATEIEHLREWCKGFLAGLNLDPSWSDDEEGVDLLMPILILGTGADLSESNQDGEEPGPDLEGIEEDVEDAVVEAYQYFLAHRAIPVAPQPARRAGPKVGRNDPCPCRSGRKYKKCCAR